MKVGPDDQVNRFKACLVAIRYIQQYGSDYYDTFSSVAKIASARLLLFMAVMLSWPIFQLISRMSSFMMVSLRRYIWSNRLVLLLRGSLVWYASYFVLNGLKQSPRVWFSWFSLVVQEFGMIRSTTDHFIIYHHTSIRQYIYLIVYVDDFVIITCSDQDGIQKLKQYLFRHF